MARLFVAIAAVFVMAVACGSPGSPTTEDQARTIEGQVWSPYCPGRLLIDCTTSQARALRASIEQRLEGGDSPSEVLDWIRRNHGEEALARPRAEGSGLAVWLLPAAIFLTGAVLVGGLVRAWTKRRVPEPEAPTPTTGDAPDLIGRVREEVERDL